MKKIIQDIKNSLAFRLKLRNWKKDPESYRAAYEKLQLSGSMHTRQEEKNQKDILVALKFLAAHQTNREARILDAGCGDGWALDQLKKEGYRNLSGIDLSEEKLEIARRLGGHRVKKALLPEIDFPDRSFDVIYHRHVFEHLLFPQETLQSFFRILAPQGILFLIAPKTDIGAHVSHAHVFEIKSLKQVEEMVKKAGFKIIKMETHQLQDLEFWIWAEK